MTMKLDCGHDEDNGSPVTVQQDDGSYKQIQGWKSVLLRDGREVCHACANDQILECGHKPSPHSDLTTGYAEDNNGFRRPGAQGAGVRGAAN